MRVADNTAEKQAVESQTTLKPATEALRPAPAEKAIYQMSPEELLAAELTDRASDAAMLNELFGKAGAKRYTALQRAANSASPRADAASGEIAAMEEKLTPEQRDRLFGVVGGPTADDYREFRLALGKIDGEITKELGQSMKWAVTKLGDVRDPSRMNPERQIAYAQLRHGFEVADEQGWDKNEVWKSALQGAAARFSPEDAAFMLRQFMKPESAIPAGPTAKIASDDSCTRRLEERDPCAERRDVLTNATLECLEKLATQLSDNCVVWMP